MMKPNSKWIEDWRIGEKQPRESDVSTELLSLFKDFWIAQKLDEKSKTTRNRYSGALHALGGYLVEKAILNDLDKTTDELVSEYVGPDDGPVIWHDNKRWQDEIDMVCRKLYRYIKRKC